MACFVLLDHSAAFNTIDHDTLLRRMETQFAVISVALHWFRFYLTNRIQAIVIGDLLLDGSKLASILLTSRTLQGSVLGPVLFSLCTVPLGDLCRKNRIEFHLYIDGTQIYITFKPSVPPAKSDCIARIERCIKEINIWMS